MKLLPITIVTLLAGSASAAAVNVISPDISGNAAIVNAVFGWRNDTGRVSNFLAEAAARTYTNGAQFHMGTLMANYSETDELTYKSVLDLYLPATKALKHARTVLVKDGTFASVVQILGTLTATSYSDKTSIQSQVNHINNGNSTVAGRCQGVLPAIDTYFSQAAAYVEKTYGDSQLNGLQSIRPEACDTSSSTSS